MREGGAAQLCAEEAELGSRLHVGRGVSAGRSISRAGEEGGEGTQRQATALYNSGTLRTSQSSAAVFGDLVNCVPEGTVEGPGLVPPGENIWRGDMITVSK